MLENILVSLDLSPLAEAGLKHAVALARPFGATITVFHAMEAGHDGEHVDSVDWDLRRAEAQRYLAAHERLLEEGGVRAASDLAEGASPEEILSAARRHHADLMVLTTHGRGGISPFSLSSTVQKVIARAPISVLVVPARAIGRKEILEFHYERVVVPVDCSQRSCWALQVGAAIASFHQARLKVVHVAPAPELPHYNAPLDRESEALREAVLKRNRDAARNYVEDMLATLPVEGLDVGYRIETSGRVTRRLNEILAEERPDLVVMCARGEDGDGGADSPHHYGGVALKLLSSASRPLLVLQDERESGHGSGSCSREWSFRSPGWDRRSPHALA